MEGGVQEMPGPPFQSASPSGSPEQHFVLLAMMDDFLCNAEMVLYFTMIPKASILVSHRFSGR